MKQMNNRRNGKNKRVFKKVLLVIIEALIMWLLFLGLIKTIEMLTIVYNTYIATFLFG